MANILLAGDSWGCGEWLDAEIHGRNILSHKGIEQFLQDVGHDVVNASKTGESNKVVTDRLIDALSKKQFDYIFWIQTDPLRDLRPNYFHPLSTLRTVDDFNQLGNKLLEPNYDKLNSLSTPIYCIGGLGKLNLELMKDRHNLIPLIPCVVELIIENYQRYPLAFSDWLDDIPKDFEEFDELIRLKHEYDRWFTDEPFKTFFYPDGVHPNRKGHEKIFEYIQDNVLTKKL